MGPSHATFALLVLFCIGRTEAFSYSYDTDCLKQVNAARKNAGLKKFEEPATELFPFSEPTKIKGWEAVCGFVFQNLNVPQGYQAPTSPRGTYAFASFTGDKPDCKAIVQQWSSAFKNFSGLPPKGSDPLYDNQENVSFVALYNPGTPTSPPAADCRSVKCKNGNKEASALICLTTPDVLSGDSDSFTQQQWDKIAAALTSSGSIAMPSMLIIGAAALFLSVF